MTIPLDSAYAAVGAVAVLTTGWGDTAVEATANQLAQHCSDETALMAAAEQIAQTWTRKDRPPYGVFIEAYRTEVRRRSLDHRALPSGVNAIDAKRGRQIAAESYATECRRQGREPNWTIFNDLVGCVTGEEVVA